MLSIGKLEALTRAGFAARGVMYFMIGFLALRTGRTEDGTGVLSYLDSGSGKLLVGIMALGFFGYALWRLSEALIDTEGHGTDAKGVAVRAGGFASGVIHFGLGIYAAKLIASQGNQGSQGGATEASAATALSLPGGGIALALAAGALLVTGLYQLAKAYRADFLRHLLPRAARMPWVETLGRAGYAARGVVFVVMAGFFFSAGRSHNASRAGDIGEALASLPGALQFAVAGGLALFGLFSFVEALYRRIADPHVAERLRAGIAAHG